MKKTNLDEIKNNTKLIARMVIPEHSDIFPILLPHPFLCTEFWAEKYYKYPAKEKINLNELPKEFDLTNNETYALWCKEFDKMVDECNSLLRIYMLYRNPYKLLFLKFNENYMSERDFSSFLAMAWVEEENPNMDVNVNIKQAILYFKKAIKKYLMEQEDYLYYHSLPDEFEVYRGVGIGREPEGLSWTMNYNTAKWFAERFNRENEKGYILKAKIKKENVLACFNSRGEDEIVVDIIAIKNNIKRIGE